MDFPDVEQTLPATPGDAVANSGVPGYEHLVGPIAGAPAVVVRWILGTLLVTLVLVGSVNSFVDPLGIVGTGLFPAVSIEGETKELKSELMHRLERAPQVVILGSSRAQRLDPDVVERLSGRTAFNAAVPGADALDAFFYSEQAFKRFEGQRIHLLWAVDAEALMVPPGDRFEGTPWQRARGIMTRYGQLLQWRTVKLSARVLAQGRAAARRQGHTAATGRDTHPTGAEVPLRSDSLARNRGTCRPVHAPLKRRMPVVVTDRGYNAWDPAFDGRLDDGESVEHHARRQMVADGYVERYRRGGYAQVSDGQKRFLELTLKLANAHGDRPTLYLTPMHSSGQRMIGPTWAQRRKEVLRYLRGLRQTYDFQVFDIPDTESFDGQPGCYYDGVHVRPENARRLLIALHERGAF